MSTPKRSLTLVLALTTALAAGSAVASGRNDARTRYYVDAPVVDVEPITRHVRVSEPREVCRDARVHHTERGRGRGRGPGAAKGAIVGTLLGGAIGNNVANDSDDRRTARLAGAVLGGVLGHSVGGSRGRGPERDVVRTERRCHTEEVSYREERVAGYRVTYRYDGRLMTTRRDHRPGDRIRVRVSVDPGR